MAHSRHDRLLEAITTQTEGMERLRITMEATIQALKNFTAIVVPSQEVHPDHVELDCDVVAAMMVKVETLFDTPGIEGVLDLAIVGLIREGEHADEVNQAVTNLLAMERLVMRDDNLLYRMT